MLWYFPWIYTILNACDGVGKLPLVNCLIYAFLVEFAKNAKIIQLDIDPVEINKNVLITEEIIGDLKDVLKTLNKRLKQQNHAEWLEKIQGYKEKYPLKYHPNVLSGPFLVEEIYRQTNGEALIVTEVGQHQMWAAQYYKYTKPRTLLTSGGLGTMGYGLGAALGAKTGCPDKIVVNIAGDGCFRMNMNEIEGDYMSDKQESLLKLAELFKILGDPTRLKIVELLLENEMCVNHIAETMEMGQSAISHQLRVLRQARLVTYRKDGKTAYYSLNDDHVECLVRMGMEHVAHQ